MSTNIRPAYCFFDNLAIHDPDALARYVEAVPPTIAAYGGRYLTIGGPFHRKEGTWSPHFPVIIEFPSLEAANAWYDSPEYAPLKALRHHAGDYDAVFIEATLPAAEASAGGGFTAA